MLRAVLHARQRHLVRAPRAEHLHAVDDVRTGPALRAAQDDHRPVRAAAVPVAAAGRRLDLLDLRPRLGECRREAVVHAGQVRALDLDDLVAVALEDRAHLGRVLAREHRGAGDLRAVEVQHREHRAVVLRVEERDALPRALERAGLGLAVTDDGEGHEVGVVHHRAEGVHEHVAELATLVDRAGGRDRHVARDAAGRGELAEQPAYAVGVLRDLREALGVGALEVARGDESRTAVTGTGEVDHLLAGRLDQARRVGVDERQAGARAPVAEQARLDVGVGQRLAQERVGHEVDLADGEVVVRAPPRVERRELLLRRLREPLDEPGVGDEGLRGHDDSCDVRRMDHLRRYR